MTDIKKNVKPCAKCGAQERYNCGKCKSCAREAQRQRCQANPEKHNERSRKWRANNLDKARENERRWAAANPERVAEKCRKWRKANPERACKNALKWQKANPEKKAELNHNRRAKVKGNGGKLSKGIVKRLMTLQKGKCGCGCGADLKATGHHLDHIMPITLGGLNNDTNVQLLTPKCNMRKGAKHPDDWARENGKLI